MCLTATLTPRSLPCFAPANVFEAPSERFIHYYFLKPYQPVAFPSIDNMDKKLEGFFNKHKSVFICCAQDVILFAEEAHQGNVTAHGCTQYHTPLI